jgi:hypothetical protein
VPGFKIDLHLGEAVRDITAGAEHGVLLAVEHLLTEANKTVPHDEGTLERSGDTGTATNGSHIRGSVSYDTPYAVRQHEDLELHHDGKGEAKWLENTMAREADTVGRIIATAIRQELGT